MTAEQAAAAVHSVIADAGFAAEVIKNDYGEDLLVQTSHGGEMDASRMWIQVKGTRRVGRYRQRDGGEYRVSVSPRHAIRWMRSADPVVMVLWDVTRVTGRYAIVGQGSNVWDDVDIRKAVRVKIEDADVFNPEAVRRLAWMSRIKRYRDLLLQAKAEVDDPLVPDEEKGGLGKPVMFLCLDFLRDLGILKKGKNRTFSLEPKATEALGRHLRDRGNQTGPPLERFYTALIVVLLEWTVDLTGDGLTFEVIEPTVEILMGVLKASSPELAQLVKEVE